jgi:hypothetical protein
LARSLFVFLLLFGTIGAVLLVLGTGLGFLLHWLMPSVDFGIGILIGVITIGFTAQLFGRISSLPLNDPLDDATFTEPFTPQRITYLIDPPPAQRRRKRKQT